METASALGHDLKDVAKQDATCTTAGHEAGHNCSRCDYTDGQAVIEALGHNYVGIVTTNPTCVEKGVKTYTCTHDSTHTYTEDVVALGHDLKDVAKQDATCTAAGHEAGHNCSRCDYTDGQAVIEALGHNYVGIVTTNPTCVEKGVKTYTCTHDSTHTYTEDVVALGHDLKDVAKQDATCTTAGHEAGHNCSRCDYTDGQAVIEALGHLYGEWTITTPATTTNNAIRTKECSVCHDKVNETVEGSKKNAEITTPTTETNTKPEVKVETEDGFDPDITVEVKVEVIAGKVEENSTLTIDYNTQLSKNETLSGVYDVKLLFNGVEIPVSDLGANATITVKMLVPTELIGKTFRIIHVHDSTDITEIKLGEEAGIGTYVIDDNGYLVTKLDRLSEFAFIEVHDNGLSVGAIVGIVVASLLGLLLIIYILGYFFLYRKGHLDDLAIRVIYKWLPRGNMNKEDDSKENKEELKD